VDKEYYVSNQISTAAVDLELERELACSVVGLVRNRSRCARKSASTNANTNAFGNKYCRPAAL
jgi:hypothetical protein